MVFCTYCGRSFSRDERLERHILTHTNVKPFKCFTCDMSFARRDLLQKHYTVHGRESNNAEGLPPNPMIPQSAIQKRISCSNCSKTENLCDRKFPCTRCTKLNMKCTLDPTRRAAKPRPLPLNADASIQLTTSSLSGCSVVGSNDCIQSFSSESDLFQPQYECSTGQPPIPAFIASDTTLNHQGYDFLNLADKIIDSESFSLGEKNLKADIGKRLSNPSSPSLCVRSRPLSALSCDDWNNLSSTADGETDYGSSASDSTAINRALRSKASKSSENVNYSILDLRFFTIDILRRITCALDGIRSRNNTSNVDRSSSQIAADTAPLSNDSSSPSSESARKRGRNKSKADESDDNSDENGRRKSNRKRSPDGSMPKRPIKPTPKFACSFNKRDPERHREWRSCIGPGWDSVHRAKEHVYRRHAKPIACQRCSTIFDSEAALIKHAKLSTPCEVSLATEILGYNKDQEKRLRSRKRPFGQTEVERWNEMYRVLFPDVQDSAIPSPFCEILTTNSDERLTNFRDFLTEQLPHRIQQRMEQEVNILPRALRNAIQAQVIEIVHRCTEEAYDDFPVSDVARSITSTIPTKDSHSEALQPDEGDWEQSYERPGDAEFELLDYWDLEEFLYSCDSTNELSQTGTK